MKKVFILSFGLLSLLASCKKSNSDSNTQHISFSLAGTSKAMDSSVIATTSPTSTDNALSIYGSTTQTGGEAIDLTIYLNGTNPTFKVGSYTDTTSNVQVGITYTPNSTDAYTCGTNTWQTAQAHGVTLAHTIIQITAIDAGSVRGTFSAEMILNNGFTNTKKVTGGDFYAKLQ